MKLKIEEQMKKREEEARPWVQENGEAPSVPEMVQVNVDGDVASVKNVYADALESANPGTKLANMESIQFVDQHQIEAPVVEKRGLAAQVEIVKDGGLVSRAMNQRHIYLEKRSAYRSYNGTTLVTGRTKSNSKTGYHQDPSLGQLPIGHVRASAPQNQLGSIITSKETHQTLSNRPIVRNSFVKKDPYQRISLHLNERARESGGRLLRPMTAPYHNQSLGKMKKNQRSV